jgi:hypothetical protein
MKVLHGVGKYVRQNILCDHEYHILPFQNLVYQKGAREVVQISVKELKVCHKCGKRKIVYAD